MMAKWIHVVGTKLYWNVVQVRTHDEICSVNDTADGNTQDIGTGVEIHSSLFAVDVQYQKSQLC